MAWTTPKTFVAGDTLTAAELNTHLRDNLNAIAAVGITGWSAYTPTWTSDGSAPALGNGTAVGYYCQLGKLVIANGKITLGSTSTVGTGSYRFAVPVTADAQADSTTDRTNGIYRYRDTGTMVYEGWPQFITTTTITGYIEDTNSTQFGAATPVVPANTDVYSHLLIYEAA